MALTISHQNPTDTSRFLSEFVCSRILQWSCSPAFLIANIPPQSVSKRNLYLSEFNGPCSEFTDFRQLSLSCAFHSGTPEWAYVPDRSVTTHRRHHPAPMSPKTKRAATFYRGPSKLLLFDSSACAKADAIYQNLSNEVI